MWNRHLWSFDYELPVQENVYVHHTRSPAKCRAAANVVLDRFEGPQQVERLPRALRMHRYVEKGGLVRHPDRSRFIERGDRNHTDFLPHTAQRMSQVGLAIAKITPQ